MLALIVKRIAFFALGMVVATMSLAAINLDDDLISQCRSLRKAEGVDPDTLKFSVSYYATSSDYFRNKPHNEYWDHGRRAVGQRALYGVHYFPKQLMKGGAGTYLFDAESQKLLWVYKGK